MGAPEQPFSRQRETRVESPIGEVRLDGETPQVRADVEFERTPVAYKLEGGIGADGAWGSVEGTAEAGSVVERSSAAFLSLTGTIVPALAFGGLAHAAGTSPVIVLLIATIVWIIALVVVLRITRTR